MMTSIARSFYIIIPIGFFIGLWWGFKKFEIHQGSLQVGVKPTVNILTSSKSLSDFLKSNIQNELEISINVTLVDSDWHLYKETLNRPSNYDIIHFPSYMAKDIVDASILLPLGDSSFDKIKKNIQSDFTFLNYDQEFKYIIPLGWSIYGLDCENLKNKDFCSYEYLLNYQSEYKLSLTKTPLNVWILLNNSKEHTFDEPIEDLKERYNHLSGLPQLNWIVDNVNNDSQNSKLIFQISHLKIDSDKLSSQTINDFFPKEGGYLVLSLFGVSKTSAMISQSTQLLEKLILNKKIIQLFNNAPFGSTLIDSGDSQLSPVHKSEFIRDIPLNKYSFPTELPSIIWELE